MKAFCRLQSQFLLKLNNSILKTRELATFKPFIYKFVQFRQEF